MKWSEFKKMVDDKLEEYKMEDIEIDFIDFSDPYSDIYIDEEEGLAIY